MNDVSQAEVETQPWETHTLEAAFPSFKKEEKVAVLIDGANMYACFKGLSLFVDWLKLRNLLTSTCNIHSFRYYTALHTDVEENKIKVQPLLDFIAYNGFVLVTKEAKSIRRDDGSQKIKGDMDVEIAVDAMVLSENVNHLVLMSGDGDFIPLLQHLQKNGTRVTVISSIATSSPMVADGLRKQADCFVDVATFAEAIKKEDWRDTLERDTISTKTS